MQVEKAHSRDIRVARYAFVAYLALLSAVGCQHKVPRQEIDNFSAATGIVTSGVGNAFTVTADAHYRAKVERAIRDAARTRYRNADPRTIRPYLSSEAIRARLDVLDGLDAYAAALSDLMGDAQLDRVDEESQALGQSLGKLANNDAIKAHFGQAALTDGEVKAVATAVDVLGRWLVDKKRTEGGRAVIAKMKDPVHQLCFLLEKDIGQPADEGGKGGSGLRGSLQADYEDIIDSRLVWLDKAKPGPAQQRPEIEAIAAVWVEYRKADAALAATSNSVSLLGRTHDQLDHAFNEDDQSARALIGQLIIEAKRAQKFYKSLDESEK